MKPRRSVTSESRLITYTLQPAGEALSRESARELLEQQCWDVTRGRLVPADQAGRGWRVWALAEGSIEIRGVETQGRKL